MEAHLYMLNHHREDNRVVEMTKVNKYCWVIMRSYMQNMRQRDSKIR